RTACRSANLGVVLLAIDRPAGAVLHPLDAIAFAAAEPAAIGAAARFVAGDMAFAALEPIGFAAIEFAGADAVIDAVLLAMLALVDPGLGRCGGGQCGQADQRGA